MVLKSQTPDMLVLGREPWLERQILFICVALLFVASVGVGRGQWLPLLWLAPLLLLKGIVLFRPSGLVLLRTERLIVHRTHFQTFRYPVEAAREVIIDKVAPHSLAELNLGHTQIHLAGGNAQSTEAVGKAVAEFLNVPIRYALPVR